MEVCMTDFEFILKKCKKYHFTSWNEEELRECKEVLPSLTREELVRLYRNKWVSEDLRKVALKVLFADKIGKREERIKNLTIEELIEEFKDKKSGNVALIRKEMRERYKANINGDKHKIAAVFNASLKSDRQWVLSQKRKEQSENAKGTWSSPTWKK